MAKPVEQVTDFEHGDYLRVIGICRSNGEVTVARAKAIWIKPTLWQYLNGQRLRRVIEVDK